MAVAWISTAPDESPRSASELISRSGFSGGKVATSKAPVPTRISATIEDRPSEPPPAKPIKALPFVQPPAPKEEERPTFIVSQPMPNPKPKIVEAFLREPDQVVSISPIEQPQIVTSPFQPIAETAPMKPPRHEPLATSSPLTAPAPVVDPVALMPLPVSLPVAVAASMSPVGNAPVPADAPPIQTTTGNVASGGMGIAFAVLMGLAVLASSARGAATRRLSR